MPAPAPLRRSHRGLAAALLAPAALLGCNPGSAAPEVPAPSFVARWADRPWEGDASASLVSRSAAAGDTLYVNAATPVDAGPTPREIVRVRVPFRGVGGYAIASADAQLVELVGGDVATAIYLSAGADSDSLVVTRYDGAAGTIEGTLRFAARSTSRYASYGTLAHLTNSRFTATVRRYP